MSAHYLNPVVPENYTNRGTTGDFSANYERDLTPSDRLSLSVRHELSRFEIPNELVQEQAGQLQTGDNFETLGTVRYQHIFSPDSLGTLAGMVRDNANDLYSNQNSTPIIAFQHNDFREGYFKAAYSLHHGNQEFKAGVESDTTFLHENFNYTITDPTQFDDGTPAYPAPFLAHRPDLEQSAFVEDLIRLGNWTVSAGLRWDHYQLLLNQSAFSPRVSVGRYCPVARTWCCTPPTTASSRRPRLRTSSSPARTQIDRSSHQFLRLPVQPSRGNYYEGGLTKAFATASALDVNVYRRDVRNYADDDQLLNTGVSYPIAFDKSVIYGAEGQAHPGPSRQALRLRQLLLHGRQRLVPRHRRPLPRRRRRRRPQPDHRPLPRLAGPAQHPAHPPPLPARPAPLGRRRRNLRLRPALRLPGRPAHRPRRVRPRRHQPHQLRPRPHPALCSPSTPPSAPTSTSPTASSPASRPTATTSTAASTSSTSAASSPATPSPPPAASPSASPLPSSCHPKPGCPMSDSTTV